jgi:hypothetical protein
MIRTAVRMKPTDSCHVSAHMSAIDCDRIEDCYDSELDTPCTFFSAEDEELRCMPAVTDVLNLVEAFTDEDCTVPRNLAVVDSVHVCGDSTELPAYLTNVYYPPGCSRTIHIHQVEGPVDVATLPPLYRPIYGPGTCDPYEPDPESQWVLVGPKLEPSTFMAAEVSAQ